MTDLQRVKSDTRLFTPLQLNAQDKHWLGPGGVIDMDAPRMRQITAGQAYKFEPAPEGSVPSPVPRVIRNYVEALEEQEKRAGKPPVNPTAEAAKAAVERAEASGVSTGIQKPDERPKKSPKTEAASPA